MTTQISDCEKNHYESSADMQNSLLIIDESNKLNWLRQVTLKGTPLIVAGITALGCAYVGLNNPETKQLSPTCTFYALTGWYCPGCGMTRAAYSLMHFHFLKAIRYNLLLVIAIPVLLYLYVGWLGAVYLDKKLPTFTIPRKVSMSIIVLLAIFIVGRNLPFHFAEFFALGRIK